MPRKNPKLWYSTHKEEVLKYQKEYQEKNKEKIRETKRRWREENKAELKKKKHQYYLENKEKISNQKKEWVKANKERKKETDRKWREQKLRENPRYFTDKKREWIKKNPEKHSIHLRVQKYKRRAAGCRNNEKGRMSKIFSDLVLEKLREQEYSCLYCGTDIKTTYTIDHIVPISKGGKNEIENIDLVCSHCNSLKGVKSKEEFLLLSLDT